MDEIEWLGFKLTTSGVSPINEKVQGIMEILHPKNLKNSRSYLGAVKRKNNFFPELASLSFPFRVKLKRKQSGSGQGATIMRSIR